MINIYLIIPLKFIVSFQMRLTKKALQFSILTILKSTTKLVFLARRHTAEISTLLKGVVRRDIPWSLRALFRSVLAQ